MAGQVITAAIFMSRIFYDEHPASMEYHDKM
jgi:hypothetical protein